MNAPLLGREQILAVLRDLAEELDHQGVRAEVFLVGGAAMTLAYDTRRATEAGAARANVAPSRRRVSARTALTPSTCRLGPVRFGLRGRTVRRPGD